MAPGGAWAFCPAPPGPGGLGLRQGGGVEGPWQEDDPVAGIGFGKVRGHCPSIRKRARAFPPTIFWASPTLQARKTASIAPRV